LNIIPDATLPIDISARNKIVNDALNFALKSNPSPIYKKSFAQRIQTGNYEDNLPEIAQCDWIVEVVVERLDIKQQLFTNRKSTRLNSSHVKISYAVFCL